MRLIVTGAQAAQRPDTRRVEDGGSSEATGNFGCVLWISNIYIYIYMYPFEFLFKGKPRRK